MQNDSAESMDDLSAMFAASARVNLLFEVPLESESNSSRRAEDNCPTEIHVSTISDTNVAEEFFSKRCGAECKIGTLLKILDDVLVNVQAKYPSASIDPYSVEILLTNRRTYLKFQDVKRTRMLYDSVRLSLLDLARHKVIFGIVDSSSFTQTPEQPQPCCDVEGLIANANHVLPRYTQILELCSQMETIREVIVKVAPLKERERILAKVESDYGGNVRRVVDVVRGSIIFKTLGCLNTFLELHFADGHFTIGDCVNVPVIRIRSGFLSTHAVRSYGYRDVNVNLMVDDHICELQLHIGDYYNIKTEHGHSQYTWARNFAVSVITDPWQIFEYSDETNTLRLIIWLCSHGKGWCEQHQTDTSIADLRNESQPNLHELRSDVLDDLELLATVLQNFSFNTQSRLIRECLFTATIICAGRQRGRMDLLIDSLDALENLASTYVSEGSYHEALGWYTDVLKYRKIFLGDDHPSLSTAFSQLATIYGALGNMTECLAHYEMVLSLDQITLGSLHPEIATDLSNLGTVYQMVEKYDVALEKFHEAMDIMSRSLPPRHQSLAVARNNIGLVLYKLQRFDEAMLHYNEALEIQLTEYPDGKNKAVGTQLNNMALVCRDQHKLDNAEDFQRRALSIHSECLGDSHPDTMNSLGNLGIILRWKDNEDEGVSLIRAALEGLKVAKLEPEHPWMKKFAIELS